MKTCDNLTTAKHIAFKMAVFFEQPFHIYLRNEVFEVYSDDEASSIFPDKSNSFATINPVSHRQMSVIDKRVNDLIDIMKCSFDLLTRVDGGSWVYQTDDWQNDAAKQHARFTKELNRNLL
jgi:hypothetical protein